MNIVVTGIGLISPLGSSREQTWKNVLEGHTAISLGSHGLEAVVRNFSPNGTRSRLGDFAVAAAKEALNHAGIDEATISANRIGCAVSQSKPILVGHSRMPLSGISLMGSPSHSIDKNNNGTVPASLNRGGTVPTETFGDDGLDPSLLLSSFFGSSSEAVIQKEFRLTGPSMNIAAACATGIASIETGAHWIHTGQCDIALVGAAEASLHPFFRAGFEQMGVLAEGDDASVARPFDKNRSGFVMGEGASVLVLESGSSAQKRNQRPLANLNSVKLRHSSTDPLRFDPDGSSIANLMRSVLPEGTVPGYINAHGTGTRFNDEAETRGIRSALGKHAMSVPVSSTKAATGHLLGAAGAVEAAFAVLALRDQILPPTLHLNVPDPICDLDYVPHRARAVKISSALSLSYGFGGQMGAVFFGSC